MHGTIEEEQILKINRGASVTCGSIFCEDGTVLVAIPNTYIKLYPYQYLKWEKDYRKIILKSWPQKLLMRTKAMILKDSGDSKITCEKL